MDAPSRAVIEAALRRWAEARQDRTFCPSEVARELNPSDWRPLMPLIRSVAEQLVAQGQLRCSQKGRPVLPTAAVGPIRLGRGTSL